MVSARIVAEAMKVFPKGFQAPLSRKLLLHRSRSRLLLPKSSFHRIFHLRKPRLKIVSCLKRDFFTNLTLPFKRTKSLRGFVSLKEHLFLPERTSLYCSLNRQVSCLCSPWLMPPNSKFSLISILLYYVTSHVFSQCFRYDHTAVLLLIILQHCGYSSSHCQSGAVESMHELGLSCLFISVTYVGSPGLIIFKVAARRYLYVSSVAEASTLLYHKS